VGYCPHCQCSLGKRTVRDRDDNDISAWDLWIAKTLGELLEARQIRALIFEREVISRSLSRYIDLVASGNLALFAKLLKIPKNTMWMWREGEAIPQIQLLLKICFGLNISLLDFLTGKEPADPPRVSALFGSVLPPDRQGSCRSLNLKELEERLDLILNGASVNPLPMTEVARVLGYNKRVIHRHFPEKCRAISARYLADKRAKRLQKIREACGEVRRAVRQLREMGIYPTENRVAEYLKSPGIFRDREVREAFSRTRDSSNASG
jgi:transcriptional regulator with XRE-family HTH domain